MRKIFSLLLFGVGGFLLVTALLLLVWVPGKVKVTPLDTDSDTRLVGEATYQSDARTRVEAYSLNRTNPELSDDDTAVFDVRTCLWKDPDNKRDTCPNPDGSKADKAALLTIGTDVFAADRTTGESKKSFRNLPKGAVPHEGVVNKWPFDTEKKTYTYFDPVLMKGVDAKYSGEEKIEGLDTYKFVVSIKDEPAVVTTIKGQGGKETKVKGTYSDDKTIWVDPVTGEIMKQREHQVRKLQNGDNAIDLDFEFTPQSVKEKVQNAKDNGSKLSLISKAPWFLIPLAIIAVIAGFLLWRSGGSSSRRDDEDLEDDDDLLDDIRPRSGRRD